jgi:hypothetical protein
MLQLKTLTIEEITSALKQYEANESSSDLAVKKEAGEASLLARDKRSRGKKNERNHNEDEPEEIDWGNSKGCEGVCFRCGRHGHTAAKCVSDMPADVKRKILDHAYANVVVVDDSSSIEDDLFAFAAQLNHFNSPPPSPSDNATLSLSPVIVRAKKKRHRKR